MNRVIRTFVESIVPCLPQHMWLFAPGDVHLAADSNRCKALREILRYVTCDVLVLNGDFLDTDSLGKLLKRMRKRDLRIIRLIEEKRLQGTQVVYVRGNHDACVQEMLVKASLRREDPSLKREEREILDTLLLMRSWEICRYKVLERDGEKYLFVHGDQWDHIVHTKPIITALGSFSWEALKQLDSERHTFAAAAKRNVKLWTKISRQVAAGALLLARAWGARHVFAGHTHDPWTLELGGVNYVNIGSFDTYQSGGVSISHDGKAVLHDMFVRNKAIQNPRFAGKRVRMAFAA